MREVVLDTETTGLSFASGHRLVDIGCVELIHGVPTGQIFQHYINPQRDMPAEAFAVHGLSYTFLQQFPVFQDVHALFLDFIQDSPLVIHNARFDMGFIHAELQQVGVKVPLANPVVDTLPLAKKKFPGQPASLDALCKRFQVNLTERTVHGALLDAHLLAQVYLHLKHSKTLQWDHEGYQGVQGRMRPARPMRLFSLSTEEEKAHEALMQDLRK